MATVTDLANVAAATAPAAGYTLVTYQKTVQGQLLNVVRLEKQLNSINKAASGWFGGYGENASLTVAKTNALASLNAARRHRYAGSPGAASGSTTVADLHGDTAVVDVS
jgi:hypothetical protein